jgi:formylmethanofuran dehydrogenase subunit A
MSLHLHANNLGHPGNWEVARDSLMITSEIKPENKSQIEWGETVENARRRQSVYLAHAQFSAYGGTSWRDFCSGAADLAKYINQVDDVVIDSGSVPFGPATTMTGDGPAQHDLYMITGQKWSNTDVELECGSGVLPLVYMKSSPVHSVQWAIGIEVMLLVDDPWKTIMSTDHPNGGIFTKYPQLITWLMSKKARDDTAKECHKWAYDKSTLGGVDKEFSLYDVAIVTRANPARTIGMSYRKGHLGAGADGDVTIYDIDPARLDTNDAATLAAKFSRPEYTIKDGGVVAHNGEIVSVPDGRRFYCRPYVDEELEKDMLKDVKDWFKYYTVGFANYPVPEKYLKNPVAIPVNQPIEAVMRRR